jgi:hypothetical protein
VIPASFAHATEFSEGYAVVDYAFDPVISVRYGAGGPPPVSHQLIDTRGKSMGEYVRVAPAPFSEGYAVVYLGWRKSPVSVPEPIARFVANQARYGLIDRALKSVGRDDYLFLGPVSEGLAPAYFESQPGKPGWFYVDPAGKVIATIEGAMRVFGLKEGLGRFEAPDGHFGFVDRTGKVVIAARYREAADFSEGVAAVRLDDLKYRFIDRTGQLAVPGEFSVALSFSEGLAVAGQFVPREVRNAFGFIRHDGTWAATPSWGAADSFSEGLAAVGTLRDDRWVYQYVDHGGRPALAHSFESARPFRAGLAFVTFLDGRRQVRAYIDKQGRTVWSDAKRAAK